MHNDIVEKIKSYFLKIQSVSAVYIFGSMARKEMNELSDIDIAIIFSKNNQNNFELIAKFTEDIQLILNKKVDICDMRQADLLFAYRALSEGILIYTSKQDERIEFEVDLMRRYFDLKSFFDEYYDTISKLAREGKIDARQITN